MNKTMLIMAAAASAVGYVVGRTGKQSGKGKKKNGSTGMNLLKGYLFGKVAEKLTGKSKNKRNRKG